MEPRTRSIFKQLELPDHIALLFELSDVKRLQDLVELDEVKIRAIEMGIGALEIDFGLQSERIKYLGFDYKDINAFRFKPFDFRKLLRLSGAARDELERIKAIAEKSMRSGENEIGKIDE